MLGQDYGLTGEEMNYVLKKEGYLEGDAGEYSISDKGSPYAEETDFHRGPGGYAFYNRDWVTRKWDESLTDELDITEEMKEEAREVVKEKRRQKWDEIKAARRQAEEEFLANQNQMDYEENEEDEDSSKVGWSPLKIFGLLSLVAAGGYCIYKATPHVKKWWKNRQTTKLSNSQKTVTRKVVYKYIRCPVCGDKAILNDKTSIFICNKCNYSITNKQIEEGTVFRYCVKCKAFLTNQQGFTTESNNWVCTECGFDNNFTEVNIDKQD
jgi:ribosomal protein S27AE